MLLACKLKNPMLPALIKLKLIYYHKCGSFTCYDIKNDILSMYTLSKLMGYCHAGKMLKISGCNLHAVQLTVAPLYHNPKYSYLH